ncbi:MAG: hypothetical protein ABIH89_03830 [Elusimicrobiota bacterium]
MNELYKKYKNTGVFTKEDILKDFPDISLNGINKKIYEAKKSEVIKGIGRRAIYFIVEPEQNYKTSHADHFKIAAKLGVEPIICYSSALMILGHSHSFMNIMYISSKKRFRDLKYNNIEYKYATLPQRDNFIKEISHKGSIIRTTTIERTLIDCLHNIKYSGGFEHIYKSFEGVSYFNWEKLENCLNKFRSPILNARVGFFLELFEKKWKIPNEVISKIRNKIPKNPDYFLGRDDKNGKLIKEWNIIVPENILRFGFNNDRPTISNEY